MTKPKPKKLKEPVPEVIPPALATDAVSEMPPEALVTTVAGEPYQSVPQEVHSKPAKPMGRMVSYFDSAAGVTRMRWEQLNFF